MIPESYVLIVVFLSGAGIAPTFANKAACMAAAQEVESLTLGRTPFRWSCMPTDRPITFSPR